MSQVECTTESTSLSLCLFRVVGAAEAQAIQQTNTFTVAPGQIGKYFYVAAEQARRLVDMWQGAGAGALASGAASVDVLRASWFIEPAAEGLALFVPEHRLEEIVDVTLHEEFE